MVYTPQSGELSPSFHFVYFELKNTIRWLDSLIFNDEVEAYKSWTLFLIFVSILILIAGVILLTFKKPEPITGKIKSAIPPRIRRKRKGNKLKSVAKNGKDEDDNLDVDEAQVLWAVGDASDDEDEGEDEDIDHHQHPLHQDSPKTMIAGGSQRRSPRMVSERTGLVTPEDEGDDIDGSRMMDTNRKKSIDPFRDDERHEMHSFAGGINSHSGRL